MPLSSEQRRAAVVVLGLLASVAGRMLELIVAHLLVLEGAGLARRAVGLPREAALRVLLVGVRRIVALLDAGVAEARRELAEAEAGRDGLPEDCVPGASFGPGDTALRSIAICGSGLGPVAPRDRLAGWAGDECAGLDPGLGLGCGRAGFVFGWAGPSPRGVGAVGALARPFRSVSVTLACFRRVSVWYVGRVELGCGGLLPLP